MKNKELDNILEKVTTEIRAEAANDSAVKEAAERVWGRIANETEAHGMRAPLSHDAGPPIVAASAQRIEACADFQSLMPAYLIGKLSEARSLLLVDHTHECIPCRRALKQAREKGGTRGRDVRTIVRAGRARTQVNSLRHVILRWGIAAAPVIGIGLIALAVLQRDVP